MENGNCVPTELIYLHNTKDFNDKRDDKTFSQLRVKRLAFFIAQIKSDLDFLLYIIYLENIRLF